MKGNTLDRKLVAVAFVTLILVFVGCPPIKVQVPAVTGLTRAAAEAAITGARLTVGTVTEEFNGTVPAGSVISQDPPAGTRVDPGAAVALVVSRGAMVVQGRVLFDDGSPVEGAQIAGSIPPEDVAAMARQAMRQQDALADWTQPEFKANPFLVRSFPSLLIKLLPPEQKQNTVTDANGNFTFELVPEDVPARVLVEVSYEAAGLPAVDTAKWDTTSDSPFDMGTIQIPNPEGSEMPLADGAGQTADGSVRVEGLPPEVDSVYADSFDPDVDPDVFPGEFAEMAAIPLNSSVFLWMEALDAAGNPVSELSQAATIRSLVPRTQWTDLEDIAAGTDRIEVPIYTYNEETDMWEQQGVGWLEDANRTVLPEDAQSVILDGSFADEVFATFTTNHFSWMNVDYAYIGPWTLSRIDRALRNNDCLYNAMQLAKTIARSRKGIDSFKQFDKPGHTDADVLNELGDAQGPEIKTADMGASTRGEFKGNEQGDQDDQLYLNSRLWNGCGEGATEEQKKNTTLLIAKVLLHESAHWKWDVKHDDGRWTNREPDGEAGKKLETDLFGGVLQHSGNLGSGDPLTLNGSNLTSEQRDGWLNPASWPSPPKGAGSEFELAASAVQQASPLEMTIVANKSSFDLGEEIAITVQYRNISSQPIRVLNLTYLEGYPLSFEIVREGESARVPFRGSRVDRQIDYDADFTMLQPNATAQQMITLLRDAETSERLYNLVRSGNYSITAFYSPFWGLPETQSNTIAVNVGSGGSVSGIVTDATTGQPVSGATVKAIIDEYVLATATSDSTGNYSFSELPAGFYTLEVHASGYLRTRQENVQVVTSQNTTANFSLSPLMAQGELRLVLTWGAQPSDLDSHLWLPAEVPYHVYYGRRGNLEACPYTGLDVDDTNAYGPETITISQRVRQGTYIYAIYNFSGSPDLTVSEAKVQVFDSTGLIATFDVPATGTGRFWRVLTIDGETGTITEVNEIGDSPEPYPSTDSGCTTPPAR